MRGGVSGKSKSEADSARLLLPSEAHPDQIERGPHSKEEADERENLTIEEVIEAISDTAPDQESREQVTEYRPERTLTATVRIIALLMVAHLVDPPVLTYGAWSNGWRGCRSPFELYRSRLEDESYLQEGSNLPD